MNLLVFGDSIARGAFDSQAGGWVERLKTYFFSTYNQYGLSVYNMSVNSNDSRGVLQFMEHDIKKIITITQGDQEELIIIIAIGSNDPRHIGIIGNILISELEFVENIKNIISIAQKYSKHIIFIGGFPINEEEVNPRYDEEYYFNKDLQYYDNLIKKISVSNNSNFITLRDTIHLEDLFDGLHPNAQGHNIIYEQVKAYLLNTYYN